MLYVGLFKLGIKHFIVVYSICAVAIFFLRLIFDCVCLLIEVTDLKQKFVHENEDGEYKLLEKHHAKVTSVVMIGFIVAFPAIIGLLIKLVAIDVTSFQQDIAGQVKINDLYSKMAEY